MTQNGNVQSQHKKKKKKKKYIFQVGRFADVCAKENVRRWICLNMCKGELIKEDIFS